MSEFPRRVLLPIVIPAIAVLATVVMVVRAPKAERQAPTPRIARVEVVVVQPQDVAAQVDVTGSVEAARRVVIIPQVGGQIVAQSPEMIPGGRVAEGDLLARIDPRDYELAVAQERSRVEQAMLNLAVEKQRVAVAQQEWRLLGEGRDPADAPLALRAPQLANAEVALQAARAGLSRAQLSLERTTLRAPFPAVVVVEAAEIGQVVSPGMQLATLVGTERLHVRLSVPLEKLPMLTFAGDDGQTGSTAQVIHRLGSTTVERTGTLLRLIGALDDQTRTAQVLVAVDAPMTTPEGAPPLLPGAFVSVRITGQRLTGIFVVPRAAVVDGDKVWVVSVDNTLASRRIEVLWRTRDALYVGAGLVAGDALVTSTLSLPIEGMSVEVVAAQSAPTTL